MVCYFWVEFWMLLCCLVCFKGRDKNGMEEKERAGEEKREMNK